MRDGVKVLGQDGVVVRKGTSSVQTREPRAQVEVLLLHQWRLLGQHLRRLLGLRSDEDGLLVVPDARLDVGCQLLRLQPRAPIDRVLARQEGAHGPLDEAGGADNLLAHRLGQLAAVRDNQLQAAPGGALDVRVVGVLAHDLQQPRHSPVGHDLAGAALGRQDLQRLRAGLLDLRVLQVVVQQLVQPDDDARLAQRGHVLGVAVGDAVDDPAAVPGHLDVCAVQLHHLDHDRAEPAGSDELLRAGGLPPQPLAELLDAIGHGLRLRLWVGERDLHRLHGLLIGFPLAQRPLQGQHSLLGCGRPRPRRH
mmetsp:Transcript_89250/g.277485  ORF Transcript_89250/g.277485 Transcript_89250/m.277485 type:complete len:308 (-) Transcript_89250:55-978(-)